MPSIATSRLVDSPRTRIDSGLAPRLLGGRRPERSGPLSTERANRSSEAGVDRRDRSRGDDLPSFQVEGFPRVAVFVARDLGQVKGQARDLLKPREIRRTEQRHLVVCLQPWRLRRRVRGVARLSRMAGASQV